MRKIYILSITILLQFGWLLNIVGQTKETEPDYLIRLAGPWEKFNSQHFNFNYKVSNEFKRARLKKRLNEISAAQERNIKSIAVRLNIPITAIDTLRKINFWIFSDLKEEYKITKINANAFSIIPYWSVYYTFDAGEGAHEIGHIIIGTYWGNFNSSKFQFLIEEGWASLVDEGYGARKYDYYVKANKILKDNDYSIDNIVSNRQVMGYFVNPYTLKAIVSGAFVKYLIEIYGIDKFHTLWTDLRDEDETFKRIYGKDFSVLCDDFYKFIKIKKNNWA